MNGIEYLLGMLDDLHLSVAPGDARGMSATHRDSGVQCRLNIPDGIVEAYVRNAIDDPHWNIAEPLEKSSPAIDELADLAWFLEECVTDDSSTVTQMGVRRDHGKIVRFYE